MDKTFNAGLLDKSIDDIEDLAGFAVPPNGYYILKMTTAVKVVNDKDSVEAAFELVSCIEQNNPEEEPAKEGSKFSTLFFLENPIAEGRMKELLLPVAAHFDEKSMLRLVTEVCKDVLVSAKVKRRQDKTDKDKFYADVSDVQVQ